MNNLLIDKNPIEFAGRLIVRIILPSGYIQPFYRSSGYNSKMPGRFFPFDGFHCGVFYKNRYCRNIHLLRIGTKGLSDISLLLAKINFNTPKFTENAGDINIYLFGESKNFSKLSPVIWDY